MRRSQAALDELVKPPLLLELNADSRTEEDSESEETDSEGVSGGDGSNRDSSDVAGEVAAAAEALVMACQSLTGGSSSAAAAGVTKDAKRVDAGGSDSGSRGWSGTYLGTVMALGFVLPGDKEVQGEAQAEEKEAAPLVPPSAAPTLEALLGQKKRVRQCVSALAECRTKLGCRYPLKQASPLDAGEDTSQHQQPRQRQRRLQWSQPILQAYAESTRDASGSGGGGDERNAALTNGLVQTANSGLAAKCLPPSSSGSGSSSDGNKNPSFMSERRAAVAEAATASQAATTAMATANERAGDGEAAQAAVDAYSDAIAKAWGVVPYTVREQN